MEVYNIEKTAIVENVDLSRGYLVDDQIVTIIPAQPEVQEQSHYVTVKIYENGGKDIEKIIDVPYKPAVPQKEIIEKIQVYIPYTEVEIIEKQKNEMRCWREKYFKIIDCAVWYDCLTLEEKEEVKKFRYELLDITETLDTPKIPNCVSKRCF